MEYIFAAIILWFSVFPFLNLIFFWNELIYFVVWIYEHWVICVIHGCHYLHRHLYSFSKHDNSVDNSLSLRDLFDVLEFSSWAYLSIKQSCCVSAILKFITCILMWKILEKISDFFDIPLVVFASIWSSYSNFFFESTLRNTVCIIFFYITFEKRISWILSNAVT